MTRIAPPSRFTPTRIAPPPAMPPGTQVESDHASWEHFPRCTRRARAVFWALAPVSAASALAAVTALMAGGAGRAATAAGLPEGALLIPLASIEISSALVQRIARHLGPRWRAA